MKKRIALVLTLVIAFSTLAAAPPALAGGLLARLAHAQEELDLSDQQVARIKGILAETRALNAPYRRQLRGGRRSVAQALLENPNDVARAQALADEQLTAERALKSSFVDAAAKALAVLNDEQRAKLQTMLANRADTRRRGSTR
ncbi:MAG TPA: periplasmic heavy metal sensor [Thermoanaerobaculia bacterium]|nr:periplasmic heavy metal sensor [Thermoanaerobaculia bacterium]